MDKRCMIEACKRETETHCYHCSQDICSKHFLEHKKSIQEQLPSFVDEINIIYDRLRRTDEEKSMFVPPFLLDAYDQLKQWRIDCHQQIDLIYEQYRVQIDGIVENCKHEETHKTTKLLESLEKMREQMKEMLKDGDVTHRQLEVLKKQLETIKQKEQEPIEYPDIRLTTQKIDVKTYVNIVNKAKPSIAEERKQKSNMIRVLEKMRLSEQRLAATIASIETSEKCPACFKQFPAMMTNPDRNHHVASHYLD